MGLITDGLGVVFGGNRNVVTETVQVFRQNAENAAARDAELSRAALAQFASEFAGPGKSVFDRTIDGLNRIPRPAMALGTLGLFVSAMTDPVWFADRMQGISVVPEPLWWLLGAIVGFYFGGRHQAKGQEFQRSIAASLARAEQVSAGMSELRKFDGAAGGDTGARVSAELGVLEIAPNAALAEWKDAHS